MVCRLIYRMRGVAAILVASLGATVAATATAAADAHTNRIDIVTPAAPELAEHGPHPIGVRTLQLVDRRRADILNTREGEPTARYDRPLTVEVWYPATLAPGQKPGGEYQGVITRDPAVVVTLRGRAVRNAAPLANEGGYPLIIVSHGYPGDRYLMSHLCENLAGKGYVVASISHKDSTYDDQKAFGSTLYNRPLDQLFVLNDLDRLGRKGSGEFLEGLVDASRAGVVGYSMGGYGVVNVIGGGFRPGVESRPFAPPNRLLAERTAAHPEFAKSLDPRIKAAIAIAPWGMTEGAWDVEGLKSIRTPVLFVGGSADDVSGYEKGTRALYEGAVNADRYLLTFLNAGHNAAAPIPAPVETFASVEGRPAGFSHYADAVWDTTRMNNILNHFATAFFGTRLKGETQLEAYLDLAPQGREGAWKGFKRRAAVGLVLEHLSPAK